LVSAILKETSDIQLSISHTTRTKRDGEVNGQDYHFVTSEAFSTLISNDEFVEHAKVFGNFYGTSKSALSAPLKQGDDVILEIDWQGARAIKHSFPDAISIFILPPSIESLAQRLNRRGKDSDSVIKRRMTEAKEQISHYDEFDYIIVNDDFDQALKDLQGLIHASRLRISAQQLRYANLFKNLLS
jgi:guanylate kinase